MTDEYFLPHEHYVISPVDTVSELPLDPKYTVMLKKAGNHYDGLIFKGECFFLYFSWITQTLSIEREWL